MCIRAFRRFYAVKTLEKLNEKRKEKNDASTTLINLYPTVETDFPLLFALLL